MYYRKENAQLMAEAKAKLSGRWGTAIVLCLLYSLVVGAFVGIPFLGQLAALVLGAPLVVGLCRLFLNLQRGLIFDLQILVSEFSAIVRAIGAYLLVMVYTFLWSLLFIVPGVIKGFSYSMTFYILADDSAIGIDEAIERSMRLMDGSKAKLFRLFLRFWLLGLLCVLTLGFGFLWLVPYANATLAGFYLDLLEGERQQRGVVDATPIA